MRNLSNISNISKSSSRNQVCKGISLSYGIWLQIDKDKGDIPRSRFIQRLIEKAYSITGDYNISNKNQGISSHDQRPGGQASCELFAHKNPEMEIHEDK
jgi:hypothetical protein